jgi:hypothetical protein
VVSRPTRARAGILFAATFALGLALPALAQDDPAEASGAEAAAEEPADEGILGRFSGVIQADFTNAYFFRGILQERDGFIAQPWGELYFSLYGSEEGWIRDFSVGGGVWSSFHTEETGATKGPHSLYETDWYPLLSLELAHGISVTAIYYYYTSPNGAFSRADEFNLKVAWDDSEVFGRFAVQPWINLAVETQNTAFGDEEGVGMQLGIAPTLYTIEHERYPVTFSAPIELGLGIEDYYETESGGENAFGYLSYGLSVSMPLAFVPESIGAWTLTLTGKGFHFSDTLAEANLGRSNYPVFVASVGVEF